MPSRVLLFTLLFTTPLVARADDLIKLLQQRNCPDCRLADVDLVHADLRDADLRNANSANCCRGDSTPVTSPAAP